MADGIFCGRGGQGVLTTARLFGLAAARLGLGARSEERRGVAVRGGSVSSIVRVGPGASAALPARGASFLLALHPEEGLRYLPLLAPGGLFLADGVPPWAEPPSGVRPLFLDASGLARLRLGNPLLAGQILLGRLLAEHGGLFPAGDVRRLLAGTPRFSPAALDLGAATAGTHPLPGSVK